MNMHTCLGSITFGKCTYRPLFLCITSARDLRFRMAIWRFQLRRAVSALILFYALRMNLKDACNAYLHA